jgi:hypothetical protein
MTLKETRIILQAAILELPSDIAVIFMEKYQDPKFTVYKKDELINVVSFWTEEYCIKELKRIEELCKQKQS